jgi:hypothetical protein
MSERTERRGHDRFRDKDLTQSASRLLRELVDDSSAGSRSAGGGILSRVDLR